MTDELIKLRNEIEVRYQVDQVKRQYRWLFFTYLVIHTFLLMALSACQAR